MTVLVTGGSGFVGSHIVLQLLNAGHEATVHTTGNGVKSILESGLDPASLFATEEQTAATVEECLRFAKDCGYQSMTLWTQSILLAARSIYTRAGFKLVAEEPHHSFGADLIGETWDIKLRDIKLRNIKLGEREF